MQFGDERLPSHFWDKVVSEPNSGCWLFVGAWSGAGYGQVRRSGVTYYAHRMAFAASGGVLLDGQELDHRCRTRCCCNPNHLEQVTHQTNMRRSPHCGKVTNPTGCPPRAACACGRPYDIRRGRQRTCSHCNRARHRSAYARRKAAKEIR